MAEHLIFVEVNSLIGFIGLSSSIGVADSGLYLNTLPNINIVSVNKIADEDQQDPDPNTNFKKVMSDIETRAINRFRTQFIIELNKCYKISKKEIAECLILENKHLLAVALQYLMGVEMMIERTTSSRINKYTTIDKITAQRSQIDFEERFYTELHVAVLGIDIENSDCFDDGAPDHTGFISVIETTP